MSGKKVCINCSTSYYTGREQSPLHFGLSAEGYDINSIMEGFDKELWIVDIKNNKKVWTKKEHINKMTYEKPLITEMAQNNCDVNKEGNTKSIKRDDDADTGDTRDTRDTAAVNTGNDTDTAVNAVNTGNTGNADTTHQIHLSNTSATNQTSSSMNKGGKPSKTMKPTDYTLFITYRISQMKNISNDNKKNYDCARYEWKEYKKKPDELKAIMVEVNNFAISK
jgi:hypothetical protein